MSSARLHTAVGDFPVLSGSLVQGLRANWQGTFGVHSANAPDEGSPASVIFTRESGAEDVYNGTVRRRGRSAGSVALSVTVVGGKGKLLEELAPRDHAPGVTEIPAGLVVAGIVADAGEQLAEGVETAADQLKVHRWSRIAMPGRDALDLLVDVLGWGWRVLADGTVWAGPETWPALDVTKFLSAIPDEAGAVYATDGAPLRPGVTLSTPEGERRIVEVVYTIATGRTRATVRPAVAGDPPPVRFSRELYERSYAATVQAQAADGSLVLVPDDPRVGDGDRPLRGVAFRLGIPGCKVTIPVGARVRVRFEGADPRGIYACDVDQDTDAAQAVALVGGDVLIGFLQVVVSGVPATINFTAAPSANPYPIGTYATLTGVIGGAGHHRYVKGVREP